MMKQIILLLLFISFTTTLFGEISIRSFRKVENDMTARIDARKTDQNGDVCAIIKVETTQTGFIWEPDGLGIAHVSPQAGEYWLYVPYGAKRLTIKHPQLGILRDYFYPLPIEKATVYLLTLTTGKVITTIEETIESQWLVITPEPADAAIYIDDVFVKAGAYTAKKKAGFYVYRVEAPLYHTEAGKVEIADSKKELNIKLKPAFGTVSITTTPEKDAKVIIDGKVLNSNTPCKSEALASGEHTVQVMKEMYQPTTQKVVVTDGQTTPLDFVMQPNFAEITLSASQEASLYINNQQKGTGSWNGRLTAGVYSLEAKLDKHRTAKQDIEVLAGDIKKVDLQPTPIYGSLDVLSTPLGATINLNGKEYGTTPNTINKLLIGDYTVTLSKSGFGSSSKTISIEEGKIAELNETLSSGRLISLNSTPMGATLFIDGNSVGATPYKGRLTYGNHDLKLTLADDKIEKSIIVSEDDVEPNYTLSFGPPPITDIDGNLYHTVTIGTQTWMVENLKTTRYRDGTTILNVTADVIWRDLRTGAWCNYKNDVTKGAIYGKLYNWYAVCDKRKIAPEGWHIPSNAEWTTLIDFLGGNEKAGGTLKEIGLVHWNSPNEGATNAMGFSALPSGSRYGSDGTFSNFGHYGYWWSSTENDTTNAWYRYMYYRSSNFDSDDNNRTYGYSVRCVMDY